MQEQWPVLLVRKVLQNGRRLKMPTVKLYKVLWIPEDTHDDKITWWTLETTVHRRILHTLRPLFSSQNFLVLGIVIFLFLFDKYCSIID
jgi:hypothetical protein